MRLIVWWFSNAIWWLQTQNGSWWRLLGNLFAWERQTIMDMGALRVIPKRHRDDT